MNHDTADKPLAGKSALVTGGSRGVGAVTARLLAEGGANVAVNYRDKLKRAELVVAEVDAAGTAGMAVKADITDPAAVEAMLAGIGDRFGRLDILILNASGGLEKDVAADYAMALNRDAQVSVVRKALPLMPVGGRVVFVTGCSPTSTASSR